MMPRGTRAEVILCRFVFNVALQTRHFSDYSEQKGNDGENREPNNRGSGIERGSERKHNQRGYADKRPFAQNEPQGIKRRQIMIRPAKRAMKSLHERSIPTAQARQHILPELKGKTKHLQGFSRIMIKRPEDVLC